MISRYRIAVLSRPIIWSFFLIWLATLLQLVPFYVTALIGLMGGTCSVLSRCAQCKMSIYHDKGDKWSYIKAKPHRICQNCGFPND